MRTRTAERSLAWLLGIVGGMACLALVAVVMPTSWIEAGAELTGVGPFPDSPLTQYLARSLSLLYFMFGVLTVYLALNARRYLHEIALIGRLTIVLGLLLTAIDFAVGLPPVWSWGEGPPTVVIGALIVWLSRRARRDSAAD